MLNKKVEKKRKPISMLCFLIKPTDQHFTTCSGKKKLCDPFVVSCFYALNGHDPTYLCHKYNTAKHSVLNLMPHNYNISCLYWRYSLNIHNAGGKREWTLGFNNRLKLLWQQLPEPTASGSCWSDLHNAQDSSEHGCFIIIYISYS